MASPQQAGARLIRNARYRRWCFTQNNPQQHVPSGLFPADEKVKYVIYNTEQGENGTIHWQGYVEFDRPMSLTGVKGYLPHAHWEHARGSRQQCIDYCSKEDTRVPGTEPVVIGEVERRPGKRNDLQDVMEFVKNGATIRQVYEDYPMVAARHPNFVSKLFEFKMADDAEVILEIDPKEWQRRVIKVIEGPVNPREIVWICDYEGGKGKSYLSKHIVDAYMGFYCNGGKGTDIVYGYQGNKVVVFDYVRDAQDYVNYGVLEQLKNGCLYSTKYQSGMKRFNVPHIIVFANFMPDQTKMSKDRWVIVDLKADDEWEIVSNGTRMGAALEFM